MNDLRDEMRIKKDQFSKDWNEEGADGEVGIGSSKKAKTRRRRASDWHASRSASYMRDVR